MKPATKIALSAAVVVALLMFLAVGAIAKIMLSARSDVPAQSLMVQSPSALPGLDVADWTVQSDRVQRQDVGIVSQWQSAELGVRITLEASKSNHPLAAEWQYRSYHTFGNYEDDFGPDLVESVSPPELSADSSRTFCGNRGDSATSELEDCQIWVLRARYGQYVVNLDVFGLRMPKDDFFEIVEALDDHMSAKLGDS
jgi:hypothetical protein